MASRLTASCLIAGSIISATPATAAATVTFGRICRPPQDWFWVLVEFGLAGLATEIVSLSLVFALRGGGIDIYIHAAHQIFYNRCFCHLISP